MMGSLNFACMDVICLSANTWTERGWPVNRRSNSICIVFFVLTFSSRDVKLKKFLEVSLLRCFWLLATFSVGSICVAQFQCLFSVRATCAVFMVNLNILG